MINHPNTLDEAVNYLYVRMSDNDKNTFCERGGASYHFNVGMNMRNTWGLWENETPLALWFEERGIHHADDRSGCIFDALEAKLLGKEFDIKAYAKQVESYWNNI